jgi:hypothetical protein
MATSAQGAVQSGVGPSGASLSDILTAIKNLVIALSTLTTDYLNVQGLVNFAGITAPTVIKATSGRVAVISVVVAGTSPGFVYDGVTLTARTKPLGVIPNVVGVYSVNLPTSFGLLVVPGAGQTVSGSYS